VKKFTVILDAPTVAANETAVGSGVVRMTLSDFFAETIPDASFVNGYMDGIAKSQDDGWAVSPDLLSIEIWFPTDPAERALWLGIPIKWMFSWALS
jgi:hypothetical protein